jgi:DHA1 family tetracycline resistance protein-like MFS transporter
LFISLHLLVLVFRVVVIAMRQGGSAEADAPVCKRRAPFLLYCTSAAHMMSLQLNMQSTREIWLRHYKGDFIAQAKMMTSLLAFSNGIGIIINPVLASACDAFGRKPVKLSGLALSGILRSITALNPTAGTIALANSIQPFAFGHTLGNMTALGDHFKGDSTGYGGAQAHMMFGTVGCAVICPLLSTKLMRDLGLWAPAAVGAVVELLTFLVEMAFFEETLLEKERKPFTFRSANPLAFLELFRRSTRLALLAVMHVLNFGSDKRVLFTVSEVHRQQVLKYSMEQRARFMSTAALLALPGYGSAGAMLRRFGASRALWFGLCLYMTESLLLSRASKWKTFLMLMPLGIFRPAASSSIAAMMQDEVRRLKMTQGEFQGYITNLNTVVLVTAPLFWARIYAYGASSKGGGAWPGFFLPVVAMAAGAQLVLERALTTLPDHPPPATATES